MTHRRRPLDDPREPFLRHSPDPPELWTLIGWNGQQVSQHENQEDAEAALVDYLFLVLPPRTQNRYESEDRLG